MTEISEEIQDQQWVVDMRVTEIEEENTSHEQFNVTQQMNQRSIIEEDVYVAVGKNGSSMDALKWALKQSQLNNTCIVVYLIHVFPEIHHIPTPLGKFSKDQLSADQVENYMCQERSKRRQLLQKFLDVCTTFQLNVETMLIESDDVAKAVIDLVPVLNIRRLIAGTTKSSLRKLKKGSGIAGQILKNAPETCEVKIICEGKEVIAEQIPSPKVVNMAENGDEKQVDNTVSQSCVCFSRKFM
ncbi:hypothetical protein Scep_013530 [Stephania cephalantha]|uniref:Uncharacterized protein n=1 Tax=Stephania cephalantha TaxID=152367 RepID=A0AAP0P7H6_9MAGN